MKTFHIIFLCVPYLRPIYIVSLCFLVCVVLRIHRLEQKNPKYYSKTSESNIRSNVHGSRQRNEVRPVTEFVYRMIH